MEAIILNVPALCYTAVLIRTLDVFNSQKSITYEAANVLLAQWLPPLRKMAVKNIFV